MLQLRRSAYQSFSVVRGMIAFVYVMRGNEIYFCGIEKGSTSTINAPESIILAICQAENIQWQDYAFFDVQTSAGYNGLHWGPGFYQVDRLTVIHDADGGPYVRGWNPVAFNMRYHSPRGELDPEILEVFREFIGNPAQEAFEEVERILNENR